MTEDFFQPNTNKKGSTMSIKLEIKTDNAAFEDAPGWEIARILMELAHRVEHLGPGQSISIPAVDINGNKVGRLETVEG